MKPAVRDILRMSVYSLFFLDQIPERAVVNEAVELAKLRAPKGLAGFVTALLLSYKGKGLIFVSLCSCAVVFLLELVLVA